MITTNDKSELTLNVSKNNEIEKLITKKKIKARHSVFEKHWSNSNQIEQITVETYQKGIQPDDSNKIYNIGFESKKLRKLKNRQRQASAITYNKK